MSSSRAPAGLMRLLRAVRPIGAPFHALPRQSPASASNCAGAASSSPLHAALGRRHLSSGSGRAQQLAGRNVFQVQAAAVESAPAAAENSAAAAAEPMELPTSDESPKLLRVRHSVSVPGSLHLYWVMPWHRLYGGDGLGAVMLS